MASICAAYLLCTSLGVSFIVGVSSSSSAESRVSSRKNFLICSTRANRAFTRSTSACISACTPCERGRLGEAEKGGVEALEVGVYQGLHRVRAGQAGVVGKGHIVVLRVLLDVLLVDHDDGRQIGAGVADQHRVGNIRASF